MIVSMMFIVNVLMRVIHRFVAVRMRMTLGQMQPDADPHQEPSGDKT